MARYVYEGPGPQDDGDGGIVRPLDVREFDAELPWGPWRLLDGGDPQAPPEPPASLPQPPSSPAADPGVLKATGTEGA